MIKLMYFEANKVVVDATLMIYKMNFFFQDIFEIILFNNIEYNSQGLHYS